MKKITFLLSLAAVILFYSSTFSQTKTINFNTIDYTNLEAKTINGENGTYDRTGMVLSTNLSLNSEPSVSTSATTNIAATLKDYKNSGFDRGHLAPAKAMSFNDITMCKSFL